MTVTTVTTFVKENKSTDDYSNPEIKKLIDEYIKSKKITSNSSVRSGDGLEQRRTRVYADQAAYDAYVKEDAVVNNKAIRDKWCKDNNVKRYYRVITSSNTKWNYS